MVAILVHLGRVKAANSGSKLRLAPILSIRGVFYGGVVK